MKLPKEFNKSLIVEKLNESFNKSNNSFNAFSFSEIKHILLSQLQTSKNISLHGRELFIQSFLSRFHKNKITISNFDKFFIEAKTAYFAKEEFKYTLLTSLSIDYLPFRIVRINNSEIIITGQKYPKKFQKNRSVLLKKNDKRDSTESFLKVIVNIKGKNYHDAFEQANHDLNVFRAILCLHLNSFSEIPISSSHNRAINKIKLGEYLTFHFYDSGKTVNETGYWFEINPINKITSFQKEKKEKFKKNISSWIKNLENCQEAHKNSINNVLNLYVDAFDEVNKQTCFLKGWIALENLLGTDDNNTVIKRCTAIFKEEDRDFQREILKGLRVQRNLIVHENDNRINSLVNCYHVQRYISGLLKYNNLRFSNLIKNNEEALKLLDYRLITAKKINRELKILKEIHNIKKV